MFRIKYIEGMDFFSFQFFLLSFLKGTTLITGFDEGGKDSNGSGKSTILNAVCWALFGRTLKGVQGQDVVRWGCKDCVVTLSIEGDGRTYKIQRSPGKLSFEIDGSVVRGHLRDVQSAIETTFKTSYPLFIRSAAFSQSQVEFLAASGDAEKKKLFKEILSLSRLDKGYETARLRYDTLFQNIEKMDREIEFLSQQQEKLQEQIDHASTLCEGWETDREEKITELQERRSITPPEAETFEKELSRLQKVYDIESLVDDDISCVEKIIYEKGHEIKSLEEEENNLIQTIQRGLKAGQRCTLCGTVIKGKMLSAHHEELRERIKELQSRQTDLRDEVQDKKARLQELYKKRINKEKLKQAIESKQRDLTSCILAWKHYETMCQDIDRQIEEIKNGANPYGTIIDSWNTDLSATSSSLYKTREEFERAKQLLDSLAFVKFVLSREGAVGHIIEREYATLVSYANRMLDEISNGKLRVIISPQRELKSGNLKEEIDIITYVNGKKVTYWGLSDGQRMRINIALLLALNKLCKQRGVNSFDFLLLDEVLDLSLDRGGEQDVVDLLKNYTRECHSIILISHKEALKSSFDSCISVYRDADEISHIRGAQ